VYFSWAHPLRKKLCVYIYIKSELRTLLLLSSSLSVGFGILSQLLLGAKLQVARKLIIREGKDLLPDLPLDKAIEERYRGTKHKRWIQIQLFLEVGF
jgi:hypothetical protein